MLTQEMHTLLIASRLKSLREGRSLSHEELSDEINNRYNFRISADSLKAYEYVTPGTSRYKKNLGMRLEYLYYLADYYGVSVDYILGRTEVASFDENIQTIASSTGLSEKYAKILFHAQKSHHNSGLCRSERLKHLSIFSKLITRNHSKDPDRDMEQYSYDLVRYIEILLKAYVNIPQIKRYVDLMLRENTDSSMSYSALKSIGLDHYDSRSIARMLMVDDLTRFLSDDYSYRYSSHEESDNILTKLDAIYDPLFPE